MTNEQLEAYQEAAAQLGTSIAIGMVPFVGQAIDAYDTIESCWRLYGAQQADDKENAQFDLVLALIGWIPGPGDGVKKSLRLVNKDPQRFAPILFDLLRKVCEIAGIKTSPEALLDSLFDAGRLKAQMSTVRESIADYSGYKALPEWGQQTVMTVLRTAEAQLPMMVGIVQRRLTKWKRRQPNSSAHVTADGRPKTPAPQPRDAAVAKEGTHRPVGGSPGQTVNSTLATAALEIGNAALGVGGEHIGDYYCAQQLGWGTQWDAHDKGGVGRWRAGQPDKEIVGKLSRGGSPKDYGKLFKLSDRSNGNGIDAVWRASGRNQGKPYAVVEYKSDFERDMPAFLRKKPGTQRKPGITGKLGVSGVPKLDDMLTPAVDSAAGSAQHGGSGKPAAGGKSPGKPRGSASGPKPEPRPTSELRDRGKVLVQMSREWIRVNIRQAVSKEVAEDFWVEAHLVYSRHLIYVPMWLPSTARHAALIATGKASDEASHRDHEVLPNLHYQEIEVKAAVNKKKENLRVKHPTVTTLKAEA